MFVEVWSLATRSRRDPCAERTDGSYQDLLSDFIWGWCRHAPWRALWWRRRHKLWSHRRFRCKCVRGESYTARTLHSFACAPTRWLRFASWLGPSLVILIPSSQRDMRSAAVQRAVRLATMLLFLASFATPPGSTNKHVLANINQFDPHCARAKVIQRVRRSVNVLPGVRSRVRNDIGRALVQLTFCSRKETGPHKLSRFDRRRKNIHQCWQVIACFPSAGSRLCRGQARDRRRRDRRQTCTVHTIVAASAHHTSAYPADNHSPIIHPSLWWQAGELSE